MHFATPVASPPIGTISAKQSAPGDRMTRYSISRRIKLSHLLLLFCVDHIALLLGINRLANCKRSASNLLHKSFYQSKKFKPFPKSKNRKWELMSPKWVVAPLAALINEHNGHLTQTATLRLQKRRCFNI